MKAVIVALIFATAALAQPPLAFEVASIKAADPQPMGMMRVGMSSDAGMVRYSSISLKDCIRTAYRVKDFQIQGPDWLDSARFDITAKLPAGAKEDQIPEMLQTLLAERFKLTVRHDSKEQSVYALTIGKGGAKLKPAEIKTNQEPKSLGSDGKPRQMMMFRFEPGGAHLTAPVSTLANLTELLSRFTERPVVDMTGIEGRHEFDLTFAPETTRGLPTNVLPPNHSNDTPPEPAPSLADAVQQYGLKLEARRAPLELIVVTHTEKTPSEN